MARLTDLIPLSELENKDTVILKNVELPIDFNFLAMEKIASCYDRPGHDGDFSEFEQDIQWLTQDERVLNTRSFRVMSALIYGMVEAGGTECTISEIKARLDFDDETVHVFETCFNVFQKKYFDGEDLKKSTQPQDRQKAKNQQKNQNKNPKKKNNYNRNKQQKNKNQNSKAQK